MGMAKSERTSLTAEAWETAAFQAFTDAGLNTVAIEPLAKKLNTTKGSFYWHFKNRAELVDRVLDRWLAATQQIIDELAAEPRPQNRLFRLFDLVFTDAPWRFAETDLLSHVDDPAVGRAVAKAAEQRLTYMADCLVEAGSTPEQARNGALQAYALWIGILQLSRSVPDVIAPVEDAQSFHQATLQLLTSMFPSEHDH